MAWKIVVVFYLSTIFASQEFNIEYLFANIDKQIPDIAVDVERLAPHPYAMDSYTCCNDEILKGSNYRYDCCAGKLFDRQNEICCFPNIFNRKNGMECCGDRLYNVGTQVCDSEFTVMRVVRENAFGEKHHLRNAGNIVVKPKWKEVKTCGYKIMDPHTELCCNSQIYKDPLKELSCCEGQVFDEIHEICCMDETTKKFFVANKLSKDDNECCTGQSYNSKTHLCHKDKIHQISSLKYGDNTQSCGGKLINTKEKICCKGPFVKTQAIDKAHPDDKFCCGGQSAHDAYCCFDIFDRNVAKLYPKSKFSGQDCCGTELINKTTSCCGYNEVYDPQHDTCCESVLSYLLPYGKVYKGQKGKCCGFELYNEKTEMCCGVTIIPKPPTGTSACCINYVTDKNVTCAEILNAKRKKKYKRL